MRRLLPFVLLSLSCGGSDLTQIVVVVTTDLSAPGELDEIQVSAASRSASGPIGSAADLPATVSLVPSGSPSAEIAVSASARRDGSRVVSQTLATRFRPGESRMLVFELLRECIGMSCPPGQTCGREDGAAPGCRPSFVDPATLPPWSGNPDNLDGGPPPMMDGGIPFNDETFVEVAAGERHSCARTESGRVWCWGDSRLGQLGGADGRGPALVPGLAGVTAIAAGESHTCAIAGDAVLCWGDNSLGQLGAGHTMPVGGPTRAALITTPSRIVAGSAHTCAVVADGVQCWGDGSRGQLALSGVTTVSAPSLIEGFRANTSPLAIDAGARHTCALAADESVRCFGDNEGGQLGTDPAMTRFTHERLAVGGIDGVRALALGATHSCAIRVGLAVWCWGDNARGQLGDGTAASRPMPAVADLMPPDAMLVAAGGSHTCALRTDGRLACWGDNSAGQLGLDLEDGQVIRPQNLSLTGVTHVSAGDAHTCAVVAGRIKCWGANNAGQLGDGTAMNQRAPVDVVP